MFPLSRFKFVPRLRVGGPFGKPRIHNCDHWWYTAPYETLTSNRLLKLLGTRSKSFHYTPSQHSETWTQLWTRTITVEPTSRESIKSNLEKLLSESSTGTGKNTEPRTSLLEFVWQLDLSSRPEAFDVVWNALFDLASKYNCLEELRDQTYYWTENFLILPPGDVPDEGETEEILNVGLDEQYISTSLGAARLFALGYGYSDFAWNSLLQGLGFGNVDEELRNSDTMRIAACAQLLGAGQRLKLFLSGGGDENETPGFAGKYLKARSGGRKADLEQSGVEAWESWMEGLRRERELAGPRARVILEKTGQHLSANGDDLSSEEAAKLIWPLK